MKDQKYRALAEKLARYYTTVVSDSAEASAGRELTQRWLELLAAEEPSRSEVRQLLDAIEAGVERGGTAWHEMSVYAKEWANSECGIDARR